MRDVIVGKIILKNVLSCIYHRFFINSKITDIIICASQNQVNLGF